MMLSDIQTFLVLTDKPCSQCDGTGLRMELEAVRCIACGGTGRKMIPLEEAFEEILRRYPQTFP